MPPRKFLDDPEFLPATQLASMRPGRCHPGNRYPADGAGLGSSDASMRPGRCHPGNGPNSFRPDRSHKCFNEAGALPPRKWPHQVQRRLLGIVASMRPGRCHPGNSPCGTPCAAWVFHPFCERWPLCLLEHANCSPNAYHDTVYLLVIQIESTLRELPAFFLPPEHSQGTRQIPR